MERKRFVEYKSEEELGYQLAEFLVSEVGNNELDDITIAKLRGMEDRDLIDKEKLIQIFGVDKYKKYVNLLRSIRKTERNQDDTELMVDFDARKEDKKNAFNSHVESFFSLKLRDKLSERLNIQFDDKILENDFEVEEKYRRNKIIILCIIDKIEERFKSIGSLGKARVRINSIWTNEFDRQEWQLLHRSLRLKTADLRIFFQSALKIENIDPDVALDLATGACFDELNILLNQLHVHIPIQYGPIVKIPKKNDLEIGAESDGISNQKKAIELAHEIAKKFEEDSLDDESQLLWSSIEIIHEYKKRIALEKFVREFNSPDKLRQMVRELILGIETIKEK